MSVLGEPQNFQEFVDSLPQPYFTHTSDRVIITNYHHSGFFLRPHRNNDLHVICMLPAESGSWGRSEGNLPILEQLQASVPYDTLTELYGEQLDRKRLGIGPCSNCRDDTVLGFRTHYDQRARQLWDIGIAAIDNFWSSRMYDQSA